MIIRSLLEGLRIRVRSMGLDSVSLVFQIKQDLALFSHLYTSHFFPRILRARGITPMIIRSILSMVTAFLFSGSRVYL